MGEVVGRVTFTPFTTVCAFHSSDIPLGPYLPMRPTVEQVRAWAKKRKETKKNVEYALDKKYKRLKGMKHGRKPKKK